LIGQRLGCGEKTKSVAREDRLPSGHTAYELVANHVDRG